MPAMSPGSAIARWDNEGGAGPTDSFRRPQLDRSSADTSHPTVAELARLHSRIIALESLVITLLAERTERQLDHVAAMAALITPRPGATPHPLTTEAATQMLQLVERGRHFRATAIAR
jgi:hypothetical protein